MAKQTFTTGQVLTAAQMTSLQQTAMGGGAATAKTASYVLVAADAGTTVAMNAAGSTTITVNSGLFAAGDTVFIQNLGAGACTVTAGTATVATAGSLILPQNDAGILYFTSASAAIFYDYIQAGAVSPLTTKGDLYTFSTSDARLPVGANGTTLVADSSTATGLAWSTPSSGGSSWSLLNAGGTALTGAATITVSGISGVDKIQIIVEGASSVNASTEIKIRFNTNTSTVYRSGGGLVLATATAASIVQNSGGLDNAFLLGSTGAVRTDNNVYGGVSITGCNSSGFKSFSAVGAGGSYGGNTGQVQSTTQGIFESTATISSISVLSINGNFDAGTVYVYTSVS